MCSCHETTLDLEPLNEVIDRLADETGSLIPILQRAQAIYGYLPPEVLTHVAERTDTPLSQVFGVVTFYSQFYLTRRGRCVVRQCDGTACHVRGSGKLIDTIEKELGLRPGETSPDFKYTFEVVYCLGSCGLAPVTVVNDTVQGRMVPQRMVQILKEAG